MGLGKKIISYFDNNLYDQYRDAWDNRIFRELTLKYLTKQDTLLDIGAGRGALPEMNFKGQAAYCVGVDPDEVVKTNPYVQEAHVGFGHEMPFLASERFDVVVSNNVLEHIDDPDDFFTEVARVMKKGGIFITKTPNLYHYMPTISRLTPFAFHDFYGRLIGRPSHDTFPTFYRANTKQKQKYYAKKAGFQIESMQILEGRPEYLRFNALTYTVGMLYERIVNLLGLDGLKIVIFTVYRKI